MLRSRLIAGPLTLAVLLGGATPASDRGRSGVDAGQSPGRQVEPEQREVPLLPRRGGASTSHALEDLDSELEKALRSRGRSARLLEALGRVRFRLARYRQAELAFLAARQMSRKPAPSAAELQAREYRRALEALHPLIPPGHSEVRLARLRSSERAALWAAASARRGDPRSAAPLSQPELRLFIREKGRFRQRGPAFAVPDPRPDIERAFSRLTLYSGDLLREPGEEVAVETLFVGGSWTPTHLSVFVVRGGKLARVLRATSSEPLWIEDLDHDGNMEVGNYHEIGDTLAHAEQPRWTDIYSYRDRRYRLANASFPQEFREVAAEIAELLKRQPDDAELAFYLGMAHEILNQPLRARAAYYQAAALYQGRLQSETAPELRKLYEERRVHSQRRIRALRSGFPRWQE